MYYNTTKEQGEQLAIFKKRAKKQDDKILEFFQDNPMVEFGASQVWNALFYNSVPITSVRRSITNLVQDNKLEYTGRKRKGVFGRNESLIRLK
jgi:hypothetical protein